MALFSACSPTSESSQAPSLSVEAHGLTGRALERPLFEPDQLVRLTANLDSAAESLRLEPNNPDQLIWVGRRLAYLGRYREAIDTFTAGIERFPNDARFPRHRGHRYLTVREPDRAVEDFTRASHLIAGTEDRIEPDGAPNARNIPLSTEHFNIWYHLGLAHYVNGDYERALAAYDSCMTVSKNPDLEVATSYWRYLTLRKLGRQGEAAQMLNIARANPELIENTAYLRLLRLFAGLESIDSVAPAGAATVNDATVGYGVSMWHLFNGREADARAMWKQLSESPSWASFGVLAAEAELRAVR